MNQKVVFLVFPGFELLDLSGPQTVFHECNNILNDGPEYEFITTGFEKTLKSETGFSVNIDTHISKINDCDTLVIPGGQGSRNDLTTKEKEAIKRLVSKANRVVSICTGLYILMQIENINLTYATSHWAFCDELQAMYPELTINKDKLYINDGKFWTSAGITAGIDLTLALIESDFNSQIASKVAKMLVVYLRRDGGQNQFSKVLKIQDEVPERLDILINWLQNNLHKQTSVKVMASMVNTSERNLTRLFNKHFNSSPYSYLESLRIEQAILLLTTSKDSVKQVAITVGYHSYNSFKKSFISKTGISPNQYRRHFK